MLIHASRRDATAGAIAGEAHIVIAIDIQAGTLALTSYRHGERDASYARLPDSKLLPEIEKLLAELRAQLSEAS